jgi:hypothetical protein
MYHGAAVLPAAANGLVKMLRLLMRLAIALQWRTDDPTSGVALYATRAGGHHTWVEHEIARYLEVHGPGTLARRAIAAHALHRSRARGRREAWLAERP